MSRFPVQSVSAVRTLEHVLDVDAAVTRGFARAVADSLSDGPLTLATRDRLLCRAQRLGIGRFDANLIVAAVEQRARMSAATPLRITTLDPAPARARPRMRWVAPASAAAALQMLIALGAWWLLR